MCVARLHDRVVPGDRRTQRVGVEEARPRTGVGAERREQRGLRRRTRDAGHLVAGGDQRAHRPPPEHSRRSGNEDPHGDLLSAWRL